MIVLSSEDVDAIINDETYVDATASIAQSLNMSVSDYFPAILKQICLEGLKATGHSRQDLLDCLHNDTDQVMAFCVKKLEFLKGTKNEQDYPEGEEPDKDDADEVLEVLPISPAFLIGHLCEFHLLKHGEDGELAAYLKKQRIPGVNKYVRDLKRIFSEIES